ncbi:DUF1990 family protein [Microbacterium album]|uniref:DUF1990 domain-containing protein n=1 Tax=Microbacterium album TaxID=2053191 RepID=A0A917MN93_9MICO|nr:DUF1990 domain-containing protein [Microbacterium album]GGH48768.1 DUF1990 domain-containing protein [Microbacterium album]
MPGQSGLTYDAIGATRRSDLLRRPPRGYRPIDRRVRLGSGDPLWRDAGDQVLRWALQRRAGIRVRAPRDDGGPLRTGDVAVLRIGLWPRDAPCRVVYTIDEPAARGFAYGTLPGHPERGEEAFIVERDADGSVWLRIRAFSRPASAIVWAGYPIVRLLQEVYTRRYERALVAGDTRSR